MGEREVRPVEIGSIVGISWEAEAEHEILLYGSVIVVLDIPIDCARVKVVMNVKNKLMSAT